MTRMPDRKRYTPFLLWAPLTCAIMLSLAAPAEAQKTSYWRGFRYPTVVQFNSSLPDDVALAAKSYTQAAGYMTRVETRNGKRYVLYYTTFAWDGNGVSKGTLSWVTARGAGADWRTFNISDPKWATFAQNLVSASKPYGRGNWRQAGFYFIESPDSAPPPFSINPDGTSGPPTPVQLATFRLEERDRVLDRAPLSGKDIGELRLKAIRGDFLTIANAGRANPNYRRQNGNREAVNLPANLKPMRLNEKLNQAAQIQADYCAQMNQLTHDQPRNRLRMKVPDRLKEVGYNGQAWEAGGAGAPLAEYPTDWMKSETHYRPWWSLDAPNEDDVGFGAAKSATGIWYVVALAGAGDK